MLGCEDDVGRDNCDGGGGCIDGCDGCGDCDGGGGCIGGDCVCICKTSTTVREG